MIEKIPSMISSLMLNRRRQSCSERARAREREREREVHGQYQMYRKVDKRIYVTYSEASKLMLLRNTIDREATSGIEIIKIIPTMQMITSLLLSWHSIGDIVEDVVVSLTLCLTHDTRLFEQVRNDTSTMDVAVFVELNLDEFTLR
jgi:hypothetical protein